MNLKKVVPISYQLSYFSFPKNKVVSGFGLGFVSFFIFLCVVFFNVSFKNPIVNNSVISWSFSFTKTPSINSTSVGNFTNDLKNGSNFDLKSTNLGDVKNGSFDRKNSDFDDDTHLTNFMKNHSGSYEECDIFNGRWVRDDTKPYYPAGSCPYIDRDFDCHLNKRPDDEYVKWKWQPFGCEIPSVWRDDNGLGMRWGFGDRSTITGCKCHIPVAHCLSCSWVYPQA